MWYTWLLYTSVNVCDTITPTPRLLYTLLLHTVTTLTPWLLNIWGNICDVVTSTRWLVDNSINICDTTMSTRCILYTLADVWDIIIYPLFADVDTGIYSHLASQYHAWPKAKRGIAMLSVDKFPYPRKQTKVNEFIPRSNDAYHILKRLFLSCLNHRINSVLLGRIAAAREEDGRRDRRVIAIVTSSMTFLSLYISRWWRKTLNTCL